MTKYRIEVSSSVVIEAENIADAEREFTAAREKKDMDCGQDWLDVAGDLLLNAKIERLAIEEPWQE
jgi:hypothetical protein